MLSNSDDLFSLAGYENGLLPRRGGGGMVGDKGRGGIVYCATYPPRFFLCDLISLLRLKFEGGNSGVVWWAYEFSVHLKLKPCPCFFHSEPTYLRICMNKIKLLASIALFKSILYTFAKICTVLCYSKSIFGMNYLNYISIV